MNAKAEDPVVIIVPPLLATLLDQLAERMAAAAGEPVDACRRLVEVSCLTQGARVVQGEIDALEKQVERHGWPR
jgi:DNA-binding ferritin-like protein